MKSYIKFLSRNKLYTLIEAVGLILSLGFAILTGSYVYIHSSIAYENPEHERIYMLNRDRLFLLGSQDKAVLESSIPEVEVAARIAGGTGMTSAEINGSSHGYENIFVDREFFELFPYYEFVAGSPDVFKDRNNVVISESFANEVAGSPEAAIGQQFVHNFYGISETVTVAAVMEDFENTLFPYCDVIFNYQMHDKAEEPIIQIFGRGNMDSITLFEVNEGTDRDQLSDKVIDQCLVNYEKSGIERDKLKVRSLSEGYFCEDARLINHSDRNMLRFLTIVVIAILVSAVFNYINLTFALSGKRAKDMATRRLVGADKSDIFMTNIGESILFTVISFALALMVAVAFEPLMNRLIAGVNPRLYIPIDIKFSFGHIAVYALSAIVLGTIAGFLPALNASGFKPIDVIKGQFRMVNKRVFTRIFIVVQSTITVILISMSIVMETQLSHMIHRPMNMKTENIFMLNPIGGSSFKDQEVLYNELLQLPFVRRIGLTTTIPGTRYMSSVYKTPSGEDINVLLNAWDSTYFSIVCPNVVKEFGRPFNNSVWLSESVASEIAFSDSTELLFRFSRNDYNAENVGGILEDVPNESASSLESNPYSFTVIVPQDEFRGLKFAIETDDESKEYKNAIMEVHDKVAATKGVLSSSTGTADFLSDIHRAQLDSAERTIRLVEIFMILSVLLSLLGLLAMSTYYAEQKSKEITIRKVFGGNVATETLNNVLGYMEMVLVACVIGVPVAVYAAGRYLEQFGYRIENYWWVFALAVLLSFAISLLSVLWQTLKAARTNPASELKKE